MSSLANDSNKINLLKDFIGISHWQSLVAILIFFTVTIIFSIYIKKTKPKFPIRVFIGMGLGLAFGLVIQAVTGFQSHNITNPNIKPSVPNPYYNEWAAEIANWISLLKSVFIVGITMLTVPLVFLAITRVVSKKNSNSNAIRKISVRGISILLINVAVAFTIAFVLGIAFKIGHTYNLAAEGDYDQEAAKTIPQLIISYIPNSFIGVFTKGLLIPIIILGGLVGLAIKKLTKHHEIQMDKARGAIETMWNIIISLLMMFVKIMPFAVMSMLASAIINQPIADLSNIGIVIGVAYLALFFTLCWHLLTLYLVGINPFRWLLKAQRPIISGFTTQSTNATLPISMNTLKDDLKVGEEARDTVLPLSATIGLSGCAGVQAGIILSFLWFSVISKGDFGNWTIGLLYIQGLLITLVASLGISGVPGTASVVTNMVLSSLGFIAFYPVIYGIIGALDGLFDMGRTAVNVAGGLQATTITARTENLIGDDSLLLKKYPLKPVGNLIIKITKKRQLKKAQQEKIIMLKKDNDIKIKTLKQTKNSENDIKFLKTKIKKDIKAVKHDKNDDQNDNHNREPTNSKNKNNS